MTAKISEETIENASNLLGCTVQSVIVSERIWNVFQGMTPLRNSENVRVFGEWDIEFALTLTEDLKVCVLFDPDLKDDVLEIMNGFGETQPANVGAALDMASMILLSGNVSHIKMPIAYQREDISAGHARKISEAGYLLTKSDKKLSVYEMQVGDDFAVVRIDALKNGYKITFDTSKTTSKETETTMSDTENKFDIALFTVQNTDDGKIVVIKDASDVDPVLRRQIRASKFKMKRGENYLWRAMDSDIDDDDQLLAFAEEIDSASSSPRAYGDKNETSDTAPKREAAPTRKTAAPVVKTAEVDFDDDDPFADDEPEVIEEDIFEEEIVEDTTPVAVSMQVQELRKGEKTKTIVATDTIEYGDEVLVAMKNAGFKQFKAGNYLWKTRPESLNTMVEELAAEGIQVMIPGYVGTRASAKTELRQVFQKAGIEVEPAGDRSAADFGHIKALVTEEGMLELHVDHDAAISSSRVAVTSDVDAVSNWLSGAARLGILNMD